MGKGKFTKEMIIEKAAELFNCMGFAGVSLSDLMKATGLKKGGIYNHFKNKEEIRIQAFEHMIRNVQVEVLEAIQSKTTAKGQLDGIIEFFRNSALNPIIKGGCPLLNAMVDADNTDPGFQQSVNKAVDGLIRDISQIIRTGIENGEFKPTVDPLKTSVVILSTIEGGVAISRNYTQDQHMNIVIDHLLEYIDTLTA
jgi:TetR/AcrR family transcriptional repressor of nem operon